MKGKRRAGESGGVPVTSSAGVEHQVTESELHSGQDDGIYRALCGAPFAGASMSTPAGRPCPECVVELLPQPEVRPCAHADRRSISAWAHALIGRAVRIDRATPAWP